MIRSIAVTVALLSSSLSAQAVPSHSTARVGQAYELTLVRESAEQRGQESSGSSYDKDTIVERIIGIRPDGLELEYDLPPDATAQDRAASWQFPARVLVPDAGAMQLLNRAEMEKRVERWLEHAKLSRDACGKWVFTWNAFRIDCDPDSVLKTIGAFDLRVNDLRDGAPFEEPGALAPAPLHKSVGSNAVTYTAELAIDPDAVRRQRAEADVAIGEITREPVSLEAALRKRTNEAVTGTMSITLEADPAGDVRRRTKVTKITTVMPDRQLETKTITETLEKHPVAARK